jgi:hypothetical protein
LTPELLLQLLVTPTKRNQIALAGAEPTLGEPPRALETLEVHCPPVRKELIDYVPVEVGVFPFRGPHDVVVVIAADVGIDPDSALDLGVDVRVVCDVADVEDAERSPMPALEFLEPRVCAAVSRHAPESV